jgi:hypothetical protein
LDPEFFIVEPGKCFGGVWIFVHGAAREIIWFLYADAGAAEYHFGLLFNENTFGEIARGSNSFGHFQAGI